MPLPVIVGLIVLGVIAAVAIVGTLIDNAEEEVEHPETSRRDRHDRV